MFNTGITELASLFPAHKSRILTVQFKLCQDLIKTLSNASTFSINNIDIVKTITSTQLVEAKVDAAKACRILVPILIGLLRSIGRISGLENTSLLSLIYHANHLNEYIQQTTENPKVIAHTQPQKTPNDPTTSNWLRLSSSLSLSDFLNPILGYQELSLSTSRASLCPSSLALNANLETHFTHSIGSSYYMGTASYALALSTSEIKEFCQIVKKIFVKNMIVQLNRYLNEFHQHQDTTVNRPYVYRSYSEVLALVTITMFRDLLQVQPVNVNLSLCHDLKDLVQEFYRLELVVIPNDRSENALLHAETSDSGKDTSTPSFFNHHASRFKLKLIPGEKMERADTLNGSQKMSSTWTAARNQLIILANASAIELYFLCVEDEADADKLCSKCSEKFFLNLSLTETVAQAPLISSCIQVLGRLALKFPTLAKVFSFLFFEKKISRSFLKQIQTR